MPRLQPITAKTDLPADQQHVADAVLKVFGRIRGPFSILLHSPPLAERMLSLVEFFHGETIVQPQLRSIAILAAARECNSEYPWAAQAAAARRHGLREEVIDVIRAKAEPSGLTDEEREVLVYARQVARGGEVDQSAFDALLKRHDAQWLVELTTVAAYFVMISGIANAFEIPPPADGDRLPR